MSTPNRPAGFSSPMAAPSFYDDDDAASPVHRFYQMWQQLNCSHLAASRDNNPSGCNARLFAWPE
jgi:hypothetical protein